jgi:hypothetical protein
MRRVTSLAETRAGTWLRAPAKASSARVSWMISSGLIRVAANLGAVLRSAEGTGAKSGALPVLLPYGREQAPGVASSQAFAPLAAPLA